MKTSNVTKQIVLARLDKEQRVVREGRTDLGERHTFESCYRPVSLMWCLEGDDAALAKANKFARSEGYTVYTYPTTEEQPLERARKDIAKTTTLLVISEEF